MFRTRIALAGGSRMIRPQKQFSPQLHRAEPAGGCVPALALRWEAGGAPPKRPLTLAGSVSRGAFQERVVGFCEEAPGSGGNEGRRAALSVLADNTSYVCFGRHQRQHLSESSRKCHRMGTSTMQLLFILAFVKHCLFLQALPHLFEIPGTWQLYLFTGWSFSASLCFSLNNSNNFSQPDIFKNSF